MTLKKPSYEALERQLADALEVVRTLGMGQGDAVLSDNTAMVLRSKVCEDKKFRETEDLRQALVRKNSQVESQAIRLRRLANKLTRAERDERLALSGILHDHIQPLVVGARMQLWELQRKNQSPEVSRISGKIEDILVESLGALRSLSVELSPAALQNDGLKGGLNWLKQYMTDRFDFRVNLTVYDEIDPILEETSFLLYEGVKELLLNTAKHSGVNTADVYVHRTGENLISLVVEDHGKGFDAQGIEQSSPEMATLGLFSIQERLTAIEGRMLIETAVSRGTRVTLTAPAGLSPEPECPKETCPDSTDAVPVKVRSLKKRISILIVDDHRIMRQGLKGLLQTEADFTVLGEADSGARGIEMARELDPDVVLMDINLGDMSGIDATRQILSKQPEIKIIGLSMHGDSSLARSMRMAGATEYLTKHVSSRGIVSSVREAVKA
jgi:signal transduction histidine kinase/ActR/RegA family two-component response regulator